MLWVWPRRLDASPKILVKGHAALKLGGIEHREGKLWVRGELLDQSLKQGLGNEPVAITVEFGNRRQRRTVRTQGHGRFTASFRLPRGIYTIGLAYAGNSTYAATHRNRRAIDIRKEQVELQLRPKLGALNASHPEQSFLIAARSDGKRQPLKLSLYLNNTLLSSYVAEASGDTEIKISTKRLGRPGPLTLVLRFAGDAIRNSSAIRLEALLVSPTHLAIDARETQIEVGETVSLTGTLRDGLGPIKGASVDIEVMGQYVASAGTDVRGNYQLQIGTSLYPPGPLDIVAHYQPDVSWRSEATTRALEVNLTPHRPISARLFLLPGGITVSVLLGLLMIRHRERLQLLLSRLKPQGRPDQRPAERQTGGKSVHLGKNTLRGWINHRFDFRGTVRDQVTGAPLADAEIWLTGNTPLNRTGTEGQFSVGELESGEHRVTVVRQGYLSERFTITIPHRGAYHNVDIALLPVRVRLLQLYRDAVETQLPRNDLWLLLTPRELALRVGLFAGESPLEPLCELLEDTYWGHRPAEEREIPKAEAMVARIIEEMRKSTQL